MEFVREFPNDETCLRHVWRERYAPDGDHAHCPRCERERVFKRYETKQRRPAWFCSTCGFRIHPLKGTIFEGSSTSLHLWFYAMYLITSTRCGISAKHLERELGVTYKTAWRMFNKIRNQLMDEGHGGRLAGVVEADETFFGGKMRAGETNRRRRLGLKQRGPATIRLAQVASGLLERMGVALQPARVRDADVPRPPQRRREAHGLGVVEDTPDDPADYPGNHQRRSAPEVEARRVEGRARISSSEASREALPVDDQERSERNRKRDDERRHALGLLLGLDELPQVVLHVLALRDGDLQALGRLLLRRVPRSLLRSPPVGFRRTIAVAVQPILVLSLLGHS